MRNYAVFQKESSDTADGFMHDFRISYLRASYSAS